MSTTPRTDAALEGETDTKRIRALYKVSCALELENANMRAAILAHTGELTDEQLAHHEAERPYEFSNPSLARLYRAATGRSSE